MIYAELAGGLGNQMFIYAFARALGLRCNEPVTLLDRQDWKDGAPAHTVCALNDLSISPDAQILADPGFAKAHLPRQNTAKALMIKYEQRRGLMARDWQPFEARCAPALNALGLHFATDGYTPVHRGRARNFLAWGYFQSARYFDDFADEIKAELRPKAAPAGELAAAKGEWVLFLDSDDAMAPGLLETLRRELAAHPDFDWFIGKHLEWQPDGTLTEHTGLRLLPGPFDSDDYVARLKSLYRAGHWSVWKYCIRRAWLADTGVRFWDDVRWAEDWPFDLMLLNHCTRLYFLDTVFTHYRVGRQGSLLTDAKNLPKRFDALAAAQRHLAAQAALGKIRPEVYAVMLDAAADVFWPQARTAAVKDAALRKACLPGLRRLRPLYPHGTEVQTRKDWKLFQTMMKTIGPRLTLWMASRR